MLSPSNEYAFMIYIIYNCITYVQLYILCIIIHVYIYIQICSDNACMCKIAYNELNLFIPDACALTGGIVVNLNYTW